jgi:hypothetical protein
MPKYSSHILELAKRGAEARYRELLDEVKMLTTSFPHLRDAIDRDELPVNFLLRRGRDTAQLRATTRRTRGWSPAARRAAAARMKAYWARRKAGRKK